jgi:hypothetical protein
MVRDAGAAVGTVGPEKFFFSRAKDAYPKHSFARINDDEYGGGAAPRAAQESGRIARC